MTDQERDYVIFENARKLYPGVKRGFQTELVNFIKKHKDWKDVLILLSPAIQAQTVWRAKAKGEFRPAWKHFQTWINQRDWEVELPRKTQYQKPKERCFMCSAEAKHPLKTGIWACDDCKALFDAAVPPRDFRGKPMKKEWLDKGQMEVMIQNQKARR
jgi:ribosomal protein L37AE/L43A